MIFITGPLYSGKRTFAKTLGGQLLPEAQILADPSLSPQELAALADRLAREYDIITATELGGGVVPVDAAARAQREQAGRLACLLAARAETVVQMFCGMPSVLKGDLPV
ncbi:MAG: bifunctional adenosylcobinamide kinase/adenosylcobinamide-phosphate guanylyltransferase [Faecalibacterium sp.]